MVLPFVYGHRAIVIGDHRQLPPMLDKEEFEETLDYALKIAVDDKDKEEVQKLKEKKPELTEEQKAEKKLSYIEGAKVGTLVAFKTDNGKIKSAMIVKRSTKNRKFKLETKYGASFIVPFDDVIWVRTNKRWPKGVYQLLKGIDESEVTEDGREEVHS